MSIGRRINLIRKDSDLSGAEFGLRLGGIGKAMISNYEKDRNVPSALVIKKVCLEFGVNGHWLLTGQGKRYIEDRSGKTIDKKETVEDRLQKIEEELNSIRDKLR